jgi:hypothetical protein
MAGFAVVRAAMVSTAMVISAKAIAALVPIPESSIERAWTILRISPRA